MFGFKKASKPVVQAVPTFEPSEIAYASAWGIKMQAWQDMTPDERKDCRERVAYATTNSLEAN